MKNNEAAQAAIKARIAGNKNHGWGVEDSYAVVLAIVACETGAEPKDLDSPEFGALIKQLINPSQFRQKLETANVLEKTLTTRKAANSLTAGLI